MNVGIREMLDAGVHFGHQTRFWHPKMAPYLFGHRNKIHIIHLERTLEKMAEATEFVKRMSANQGVILFVGTKRQSQEAIRTEAQRCGMPYVDIRWLGGMLTNFNTVKNSVKKLKDMTAQLSDGSLERLQKKEQLLFARKQQSLERQLGGVKDMNQMPNALFIIDVGFHKIAIQEAKTIGIPVVGVVDSNHNPEEIDVVIPGNDDAGKAVAIYARLMADAVLEGRNQSVASLTQSAAADEYVEVNA